jgi:hypothetical protein
VLAETGVALLYVGPYLIWAFVLITAGIVVHAFVALAMGLEFGCEDAGVDRKSLLDLHDHPSR